MIRERVRADLVVAEPEELHGRVLVPGERAEQHEGAERGIADVDRRLLLALDGDEQIDVTDRRAAEEVAPFELHAGHGPGLGAVPDLRHDCEGELASLLLLAGGRARGQGVGDQILGIEIVLRGRAGRPHDDGEYRQDDERRPAGSSTDHCGLRSRPFTTSHATLAKNASTYLARSEP